MSQPELAHWLPWADPMPTRDAEREFLERGVSAFDADDDRGYFLFERGSGEIVGGAGLYPKDDSGVVEIGYWVRFDRIGKGYATAAAGALTAAAFDYLPTPSPCRDPDGSSQPYERGDPTEAGLHTRRQRDAARHRHFGPHW
jgi:RimJ/RimL family protein N-acetyltransferase